jgi:hypothetical protein
MKIYLTSDNINGKLVDQQRMVDVCAKIQAAGYQCSPYLPVNPNTHITVLQDKKVADDSFIVDIYGGACAGTLFEMGGKWFKSIKGNRKVMVAFVPPATNISNLAFLQRAHDDKFTPAYGKPNGFPDKVGTVDGLKRPDLYLQKNGYPFIYAKSTFELAAGILKQLPAKPKTGLLTVDMKKGSKRPAVGTLQKWLNANGFHDDNGNLLKVDNDFGELTEQAVEHLQIKAHIVVDGIVGLQTRTVINNWKTVITKPVGSASDNLVLETIRKLFGKCNNKEDLYAIALKFGHYLYYYNQRFSQLVSSSVQAWKGGINCADWVNDIGMPCLRALGYNPEAWHVKVKCSDGKWYGHYEISVDGVKEYDLAGAAAHGRPMGKSICLGGTQFMHKEVAGGIV